MVRGHWSEVLVIDAGVAHRRGAMQQPLKDFIKRWAITTLAVLVAANIARGISYDTLAGLIVATLLLGSS